MLNMDFSGFISSTFTKKQDFSLSNWHRRLCIIQDNLWCAAADQGIFVYDKQGNLLKQIQSENIYNVQSVIQLGNDGVIVTCSGNGLVTIDREGMHLANICNGSFTDAIYDVENKMLYAVESYLKLIFVFENIQNTWVQVKVIKDCIKDSLDTIGIYHDVLYVCSHKERQLKFYTLEGDLINQTKTKGKDQLLFPRICGVDSKGNGLISDWMNHKIHVYKKEEGKWNVLNFSDDLKYPVDIKVDASKDEVWILQHGVATASPNKLLNYSLIK